LELLTYELKSVHDRFSKFGCLLDCRLKTEQPYLDGSDTDIWSQISTDCIGGRYYRV